MLGWCGRRTTRPHRPPRRRFVRTSTSSRHDDLEVMLRLGPRRCADAERGSWRTGRPTAAPPFSRRRSCRPRRARVGAARCGAEGLRSFQRHGRLLRPTGREYVPCRTSLGQPAAPLPWATVDRHPTCRRLVSEKRAVRWAVNSQLNRSDAVEQRPGVRPPGAVGDLLSDERKGECGRDALRRPPSEAAPPRRSATGRLHRHRAATAADPGSGADVLVTV